MQTVSTSHTKHLNKMLTVEKLSFLLLISAVYFAEANVFKPQQETDVINFVNHIITCRNIPGLTIAVVSGSQTWTKGFGVADILNRRPVDEETLFSIGSLGKAFTATLLASSMDKTGYVQAATAFNKRLTVEILC